MPTHAEKRSWAFSCSLAVVTGFTPPYRADPRRSHHHHLHRLRQHHPLRVEGRVHGVVEVVPRNWPAPAEAGTLSDTFLLCPEPSGQFFARMVEVKFSLNVLLIFRNGLSSSELQLLDQVLVGNLGETTDARQCRDRCSQRRVAPMLPSTAKSRLGLTYTTRSEVVELPKFTLTSWYCRSNEGVRVQQNQNSEAHYIT
jgi:hypothetical protein